MTKKPLRMIPITGIVPPDKNRFSAEEYSFIFSRVIRPCIDFVIPKDGCILLVKRTTEPYLGYWSLPGGMRFHGELLQQSFDRLLDKELGVTGKRGKILGEMEFPNEGYKHSISNGYKTMLDSWKIKGSEQGTEIALFDREDLLAYTEEIHPCQLPFILEQWEEIIAPV